MRALLARGLCLGVVAAWFVGCSSIGVGVTIPIGPVGVSIGGSIPLPKSSEPAASAPAP